MEERRKRLAKSYHRQDAVAVGPPPTPEAEEKREKYLASPLLPPSGLLTILPFLADSIQPGAIWRGSSWEIEFAQGCPLEYGAGKEGLPLRAKRPMTSGPPFPSVLN